jgi:predicted Zn-dependent peptidase
MKAIPNDSWVLKNRLRVIFANLRNSSQVSLHVAVRSGVIYEDANENGVSHLLEHFHAQQASCGAVIRTQATFSAWMDMDVAHYSATIAKSLAPEAAQQLAASLSPVNLDAQQFEREKKVVAEEVGPHKGRDFLSAIYGRLYSGTPYGMPNGGRRKSLRRLTSEAVKTCDRRFYHGENMAVGIAGTLEKSEAESLAEVFNEIPSAQAPLATIANPPRISARRKEVFSWETARRECVFAFSLPETLSYDELLCLRILACGCRLVSSPLYLILRDEKSFYDFNARVHCLGCSSMFIVRCEASSVRQPAAIQGMARGIGGIKVDSIGTEAWRSEAKTLFSRLSDPDLISTYEASYWAAYPIVASASDRYSDLRIEAEKARGFSNEVLLEVARKYLTIDSLSVFVDGPRYPGQRWRYFRRMKGVL